MLKKFKYILFVFFIIQSEALYPFNTTAKSALLIDFDSNQILFSKNMDKRIFPASMSKLMTLYILFDALDKGIISLEDKFPVSMNAYQREGSTIYAELGTEISVENLIKGIVVSSGNDACVIVAESLSGSEEIFAEQMNFYAKDMDLSNTNFVNSSGLHDDKHYSTINDLSILAKNLIIDFPEYYKFFSDRSFTWNNITQYNRNNILRSNLGVDGLKTGYTGFSGYGIIVSSKKNDQRLIAVVTGLDTVEERTSEITRLINYGYRGFKKYPIFSDNQIIDYVNVWNGRKKSIPMVIYDDLELLLDVPGRRALRVEYRFKEPIIAPVDKGDIIGEALIVLPNRENVLLPLYSGEDVSKVNFFTGFIQSIDYFLYRDG